MLQRNKFCHSVTSVKVYAAGIEPSTANDQAAAPAAIPDAALTTIAALFPAADALEDETTARILDAAYDQFALVGIRRTSMEDVARDAGVSRVTVYRHVANKEALVQAVLRREFQRHAARYLSGLQETPDPRDRIIGGYLDTLQAIRRNPLLKSLLAGEMDTVVSAMSDGGEQILAMARVFVAQLLRMEQLSGTIDGSVAVDLVADLMVRLAVSFVLVPSDVVDLDDEAAAQTMVRSFLPPLLGWTT